MSHAAEQAVLGSIMLDAAAYHRAAGLIDARDFSAPEHRHLWELLSELIQDGSPIDAVTVGEIAERKGLAGKVGGSAYIVELADGTPGAASAEVLSSSMAMLRFQSTETTCMTSCLGHPAYTIAATIATIAQPTAML